MSQDTAYFEQKTGKMEIRNFDNDLMDAGNLSLLNEIFERRQIGYVIRNFLSPPEIQQVLDGMKKYPYQKFEVFPGYLAMPRPFDYTLNTNLEDYSKEVDFLENNPELAEVKNVFKNNLSALSSNSPIFFASKDNELSRSKAWASFRELHPDKGLFELHCGNVFRNWNKVFFTHQYKTMEETHLSCVVMIQKPETKEDIVIYKPHFNEIPEKLDHQTLRDVHGKVMNVSEIPSYILDLHPGDLLLFDESNYWHIVPTFSGRFSRITFGGFVSKFKNENKFMHWA